MAGNIVIESTSVASAKNEDAVTEGRAEGSKYQSVSTEKCKRYVQITILGEDKGQTEDGKIIIQQIFVSELSCIIALDLWLHIKSISYTYSYVIHVPP